MSQILIIDGGMVNLIILVVKNVCISKVQINGMTKHVVMVPLLFVGCLSARGNRLF
jgi:hypothetical protein